MIVWGFQDQPHDGWDFDGVKRSSWPFDMQKDGKTVKAGGTADRNGFFYVLDRANGKFISATPFVNKINWAKASTRTGVDLRRRLSVGDPAKSEDGKKGKSVFAVPSFLGGKNWMPVAYSPTPSCSTCLE